MPASRAISGHWAASSSSYLWAGRHSGHLSLPTILFRLHCHLSSTFVLRIAGNPNISPSRSSSLIPTALCGPRSCPLRMEVPTTPATSSTCSSWSSRKIALVFPCHLRSAPPALHSYLPCFLRSKRTFLLSRAVCPPRLLLMWCGLYFSRELFAYPPLSSLFYVDGCCASCHQKEDGTGGCDGAAAMRAHPFFDGIVFEGLATSGARPLPYETSLPEVTMDGANEDWMFAGDATELRESYALATPLGLVGRAARSLPVLM